jgi:hypothetical protein
MDWMTSHCSGYACPELVPFAYINTDPNLTYAWTQSPYRYFKVEISNFDGLLFGGILVGILGLLIIMLVIRNIGDVGEPRPRSGGASACGFSDMPLR